MEHDPKIEVNGAWLTRAEWKDLMHSCPHPTWNHPGVTLLDGSEMSICTRCLYIQHTPIAKMIEQEAI
jgi:hypothetical protein